MLCWADQIVSQIQHSQLPATWSNRQSTPYNKYLVSKVSHTMNITHSSGIEVGTFFIWRAYVLHPNPTFLYSNLIGLYPNPTFSNPNLTFLDTNLIYLFTLKPYLFQFEPYLFISKPYSFISKPYLFESKSNLFIKTLFL